MVCNASLGRQRKEHTRSRNGCSVCRKRHVRCDETRPSCVKCLNSRRTCYYDPKDLGARSQRVRVPGEQAPWVVNPALSKQLQGTSGDPFDCFPIEMPFKSRHILYHFLEMYKDLPADPIDCMSLACQHPVRFRSLLLIAASYYAWNAGGLYDFQSTYLYHMSRCIRQVNEWLKQSGEIVFRNKPCVMELIACLSITESLVGNFAASKVHLNGLITMLEIQRLQSKKGTHLNLPEHSEYANHEEIAERHAMISFDFTTGLKTHRHEVERGQFSIKGHRVDTRKGTWKKDFMGHDERLTAMLRTLRFFSIPEIEAQTRRIDARSSIEALRRTTKLVDQGLSPYDPSVTTSGPVWTFGSSALMMVSEGDPFGESGASQDDGERPLLTSRSCLDVACGFYMYGILGVGNGDGAVESRFTRQVFEILKRDVSESEQDLMSGLTDQNFWLWKVVVGAHGLALMELQSQFMANGRLFDMIAGGQSTVRMLKAWFYGQFRLWSRMTGVNEYSGVRKALLQISWPEKSFVREAIIEKSWDEALNTC